MDLDAATALRLSHALRPEIDPGRLPVGTRLRLDLGEADAGREFRRFVLQSQPDRRVVVEATADGLASCTRSVPHERSLRVRTTVIRGSLYGSASDAGIPVRIVSQVLRALRNRVDFERGMRRGDRITVVYEQYRHERTDEAHAGELVAARLERGTRGRLAVYRFRHGDRYSGFFDASGASVEMTLMRTPVRQGRLTSEFGRRRHPVLGYTRMHEGLDFAAPRGTPVVAAGNGRVVRKERYGSYGRYIRIRHGQNLSTSYAHLSGFADGVAMGERVEQGTVIGYVGATGLATGPNLHYEVTRNREPLDPIALDLPPRRQLPDDAMRTFEAMRERVDRLVKTELAKIEPEQTLAVRARENP